MPWFQLDDDWWSHPKTATVSLAALGLWAKGASWCMKQLTDGFIPTGTIALLGGTKRLAKELVDAGFWKADKHGFQYHDWQDYQRTKAEIFSLRESWRDSKRESKKNPSKNPNENPERNPVENPIGSPSRVPNSKDPNLLASSGAEFASNSAGAREEPEQAGQPILGLVSFADVRAKWNLHAEKHGFQAFDYESNRRSASDIAEACNLIRNRFPEAKPTVALDALMAWFWEASDGPFRREKDRLKNPSLQVLAARVSNDLERAREWYQRERSNGAIGAAS